MLLETGVFFLLQCGVFDYEKSFNWKTWKRKHFVKTIKYSGISVVKIVFKI